MGRTAGRLPVRDASGPSTGSHAVLKRHGGVVRVTRSRGTLGLDSHEGVRRPTPKLQGPRHGAGGFPLWLIRRRACRRVSSHVEKTRPLKKRQLSRRQSNLSSSPGDGASERMLHRTLRKPRLVVLPKSHAARWVPHSSLAILFTCSEGDMLREGMLRGGYALLIIVLPLPKRSSK